MKSLILIVFISITSISFAQSVKKEVHKDAPKKVQYEKFVAIPTADINMVVEAFNQWKRLQMYDPATSGDSKAVMFKNLETYTTELLKRVRLDSIMVKQDSVKH